MQTPLRISPDVVFREIAGEAVILDLGTGMYFGLNQAGARIWKCLDEGCERSRIADRIVEEFDVAREDAERDVERLLRDLLDRGLVVQEPPEAAP